MTTCPPLGLIQSGYQLIVRKHEFAVKEWRQLIQPDPRRWRLQLIRGATFTTFYSPNEPQEGLTPGDHPGWQFYQAAFGFRDDPILTQCAWWGIGEVGDTIWTYEQVFLG